MVFMEGGVNMGYGGSCGGGCGFGGGFAFTCCALHLINHRWR